MSNGAKKIRFRKALLPVAAAAIALCFLGGAAPLAKPNRSPQDMIEDKANELLAQRLDPKRFLIYARVEPVAAAKATADGKKIKLPFVPVDISPELLNNLMAPVDSERELNQMAFTITLIVDATVDKTVVATLTDMLKERFEIDEQTRHLTVKTAKVYAEPPKEVVQASPEAGAEEERAKLEADAARAHLESERSRLEMSKKEIEYERNLAGLEGTLRTEKDKAEKERLALEKDRDAVVKKGLEKDQQRESATSSKTSPDAKPKSVVEVISSIQVLLFGVIGLIGVVVAGAMMGGALKKAMGAIGDGIKAAGGGIGAALAAKNEPQTVELTPQQAEAEQKSEAKHDDDPHTDWLPGKKDFDAFVSEVQDKIEVLSREGNLTIRQTLVDLIDTDSGLVTAASVILALPPQTARLLVEDLPAEPVRRLKAFLETPAAVARAKSQRHAALQEFYGRIASEEFSGSPLGRVKNTAWLTRMSTVELANFAVSLPAKDRPAFLACLSPFRIAKLMEKSNAKDKEALLGAIALIGRVSEEEIGRFIAANEASNSLATKASQVKPAVDQLLYLETIASSLSPEDQQALLKAVAGETQAYSYLSRRILPFAAIKAVPADLVRDLLDKRTAAQTASILFSADDTVQEFILTTLAGVKAEAIRDELKVMNEKTSYARKYLAASQRQQREIANQLIRMAQDGTLDLDQLLAATGLKAGGKPNEQRPAAGAA